MPTEVQIAAARRYAPPLFTVSKIDRRGAKLRSVNRRAVDYAHRAGMSVETVYPGAMGSIRALAPPMGSPEASAFVAATGLAEGDVYPIFGGEVSSARRWRWGWVAMGILVGAALGGPLGAAAGGLLGATR